MPPPISITATLISDHGRHPYTVIITGKNVAPQNGGHYVGDRFNGAVTIKVINFQNRERYATEADLVFLHKALRTSCSKLYSHHTWEALQAVNILRKGFNLDDQPVWLSVPKIAPPRPPHPPRRSMSVPAPTPDGNELTRSVSRLTLVDENEPDCPYFPMPVRHPKPSAPPQEIEAPVEIQQIPCAPDQFN